MAPLAIEDALDLQPSGFLKILLQMVVELQMNFPLGINKEIPISHAGWRERERWSGVLMISDSSELSLRFPHAF